MTDLIRQPAPGPESEPLATRFGPIHADARREIAFPAGLLGFPGRHRFVLSELPARPGPFKLLQAADDGELGFLVLPLDVDCGPVVRRDLVLAASQLGIGADALAALGIVTLHAEADGGVSCTINLKAPLLIDTARRKGWQYVLTSDGYALRHPFHPGGRHAG